MSRVALVVCAALILLCINTAPVHATTSTAPSAGPSVGPERSSGVSRSGVALAEPDILLEHVHSGIAADGRVWSVPMHRKEIALTFDDGPYPFYTPLLLHQLEAGAAPATFFLIGRDAQEYPQLVERIVSGGNEIGNHTFNHYTLTALDDREIAAQITGCGSLLEPYLGGRPTLFRPPHGRYDARVVDVAKDLGYRTILWSDAPDDAPPDGSDVPVGTIVSRVLAHATPGGIVLLHSGQYDTIVALPEIIERLRADGYTFVTVSQLLADQDA